MYIPVVNLLQISLPSLTKTFAFESGADLLNLQNSNQSLAILTPYRDAPQVSGVLRDLPSDCNVNQVMLLHRHGSRGPTEKEEQSFIKNLVKALDSATLPDDLPENMRFLKKGYKYDLVPNALTIIGRQQLFNHGVGFALQYPTLSTNVLLSSTVQRVTDSAHFFGLGHSGNPPKIVTVDKLNLPVDWISPWESCPKFDWGIGQAVKEWTAKYVPPITERLNKLLPGVNLSDNDTQGALLACSYDLAARGRSPWCGVFTSEELRGLEYQYDLMMDYLTGHKSTNHAGPVLGSVYVNKLIERFTNATEDARPLYLEFGHDFTILLAMAAMDLNKDENPLPSDAISSSRKFRTSDQTPFGARMIWERFSCRTSFEGPQIRLLLNSATYPLTICQKSSKDKKYGTCLLDEFVKANKYSTDIHYGDESWKRSCGN